MASIVADTKLVTLKLFVTSAVKAGKLKPQFSHPPLQVGQSCDPDLALEMCAKFHWVELLGQALLSC